ncbi:MAG: zf-HC2 domain-containing protein [Elusimicrobia bacterium]|nr:zf-HC2 domain-containing protein [Elusimicrobiota bacterium]
MTDRFRCWSTENILDLFVDGRLAAAQEARVGRHLEACPSCRARAEELQPLAFKAAAPAQAPAGLADAILRRFNERSTAPAAPVWRLTPAQAVGLAALALLALSHGVPGPTTAALKPAAVEAPR